MKRVIPLLALMLTGWSYSPSYGEVLKLNKVELNIDQNSIAYTALVAGEFRKINYQLDEAGLSVRVDDEGGTNLASFKFSPKKISFKLKDKPLQQVATADFAMPTEIDQFTQYILKSNLLAARQIGWHDLVGRFKDDGSLPEDQAETALGFTFIIDWFIDIWTVSCTAYSSTETCESSDGTVTSITCGCGEIAYCERLEYQICYYMDVTVDGVETTVEICDDYNTCVCQCLDPDADFAPGPYSE